MSAEPRILIIGAGPTGLGAAWRLQERGHSNWMIYEAAPHPGGLATSIVDPHGFTWDLGGHVLFSHYKYFDQMMDRALGSAWVEHVREAWVWMRDRWIPYPFQNNIWRLPQQELDACLDGLRALQTQPRAKPATFREWLLASFGQGICDSFLFPYNKKVWAYDPSRLNVEWMGERVATVDLNRILRNIEQQRDDVSWGPNSTFRFPLHGGTGAIWTAVATLLPQDKFRFNASLSSIDTASKHVTLSDGQRVAYDVLISTVPLDLLIERTDREDLAAQADRFVYSSSHIVGIGIEGKPPDDLKTKCWIYFPEPNVPFYRGTVFSNYSPNNVPPGPYWSLMGEVSESPDKPVNHATIVDDVVDGFRACGFLKSGKIVSRWHRRLEHGYPTPWLGRDSVLEPIDKTLRASGIYSRGRFGAWRYEVSNQDHSFMQGAEVVDHILIGTAEHAYHGDMSDGHVHPL